jgi:hypothetical protein
MSKDNDMKFTPEKLNLWDRLFNRYRKEVKEQGKENWTCYHDTGVENFKYMRSYVEYYTIDRLTGSYTIQREYLTGLKCH